MRLEDNLVLFGYISDLLGGDYDDIVASLQSADEGKRPDGQSNFYSTLEQRASRLRLHPAGTDASLRHLGHYDRNVLVHEAALARQRPNFRLKYFQYLAALYTEIYLHHLKEDPASLLLALDDYRADHYADLPAFEPRDLQKLAFWMATGSGKTLLLHINLRQFEYYRPIDVRNILLLTPSPTLSHQHLNELRLSGFADAEYALDIGPGYHGVQVLEITKLYVDGTGTDYPRGGVSLPTSVFEGPNLVLVDEGHKGTATKTDRETERAWRDIRNALVADGGFTFEYSATFAQVTENDDELCREYARTILYEYAYASFHRDGYGKDFDVINLKKDDSLYGDTLLLGGLLTFYQQHRRFHDPPQIPQDDIRSYQIAPPLMVFVGAYVTGGVDVLQVVQFLDRVLKDETWAVVEIANLLAERSGLPGEDGRDAFVNAFSYLKQLGLTAQALYDDLRTRLFRGRGRLSLHLLRRAEGEIGIRTKDSADDAYCGVVNVGDATGFLRKVERETDISVGLEDHITYSLFEAIEEQNSPIVFLVGSKKFIEGWSSWRVSVMGLLRVGRSAGAQVLQLFGRGVRLKGQNTSLRRSQALPGSHPPFLPLLETLHIFGLKANYLQTFLTTLDREGVKPPVTRLLPIDIVPQLDQLGLRAVQIRPGYDFKQAEIVAFDPAGGILEVSYDLTPKIMVGRAGEAKTATLAIRPQRLPDRVLKGLNFEDLFYHALAYKAAKGWDNLYISRLAIRLFFEKHALLAAPDEVLDPKRSEHWSALDRAAEVLLEKGLESFYYRRQRKAETEEMISSSIDITHSNFPRIEVIEHGQPVQKVAYQLKIPLALLAEVEAIIRDQARRLQSAMDEPLPRLHVDMHLYWPLLLKDRATLSTTGGVSFLGATPGVSSTPTSLELSEVQFVVDLRRFWEGVASSSRWAQYHIYLLRNLPKKGIGFFQTVGFYPDFLLWVKHAESETQSLAFIDPKGLTYGSWKKVELLQDIRALTPQVGFPLFGYIVTLTPLSQIPIPANVIPDDQKVEDWLQARYVLHMQGEYIREILEEMQSRIT